MSAPAMLAADRPAAPEALCAPAASGERDVAAILSVHGDFVWRTLQRLGVRDADLEDTLQEVLWVVHKRIETFDGRSKITTWLYAICVRVASTHRRRAWVRRERPTSDLPEQASDAPGPEESLSRREDQAALSEVLDLMDIEKRALLVMFEIDELSCEEIGDLLGVPVGTVHSRLHAARRELEAAHKRWRARSVGPKRPFWHVGRSS